MLIAPNNSDYIKYVHFVTSKEKFQTLIKIHLFELICFPYSNQLIT